MRNLLSYLVLIFLQGCFITCRNQIVIAHRGASGYFPEHTLEAKTAALVMGSDYIEQDIVLSRDNIPIVLHDIYLDSITDVAIKFANRSRTINNEPRYYAVDFDLAEIKKLKVSERFDHKNLSNGVFSERFPVWQSTFQLNTLEEEIQLIEGYEKTFNSINLLSNYSLSSEYRKFGLYVEIKRPDFHRSENKSNFSEIVLNILNKYGYSNKEKKVFIQCFDPSELM